MWVCSCKYEVFALCVRANVKCLHNVCVCLCFTITVGRQGMEPLKTIHNMRT